MNSLLKGLFMGIVAVIGAAFTDMETFNFAYITIVVVVFTGQYLIKNWVKPSLSDKLSVSLWDFISGVLVALFMGLSVYAGTLLTDVVFSWSELWKAVSIAVIGYFTKTVPTQPKTLKK